MEEKKLSPYEKVKAASNYLRGTLKESLAQETTHFTSDEGSLLKPHGTYQQDDRDKRQELLKQKKEPAYSMMVRIKIPGGYLTADQYLAYDDVASQYANGTLRITTRQGFQFHGVLKKNLKTVIHTINEKLNTTSGACGDNVRNVLACPAPLSDRKKLNILKYAQDVSDTFLPQSGAYHEIWMDGKNLATTPANDPEPIYGKTYLPRKFKIAIAYPEDNCTDVFSNDLAIVPEILGGTLKGFNLFVGGGFGMTHGITDTYPRLASPLGFVKPQDLIETSKAVVMTQRDFGNRGDRKRARLKYLLDDKGVAWFREEVEKRLGKKVEDVHPIHWHGIDNHLGWYEEGDGRWFFGVPVESGRIKDEGNLRMKSGFRAFVEKFRPSVYLTCQQDIIFSGFAESQKQEVEAFLSSYGIKLPSQVSNVRKDSMACPALPTCGLAITESERALPGLMTELEKKLDELGLSGQRLMIRMTGCPNGCARPYNAEIAFVGKTVGTYNVYIGGSLKGDRLNFLYKEKVLQKDLAASVYPLLEEYQKSKKAGEGLGDYCNRLGAAHFRTVSTSQKL